MDSSVLFRTMMLRKMTERAAYPNQEGNIKTAEDLKKMKARYWGKVTLVDEMLGRVLKALKRQGLDENTIIVFTTDHGEMMGDHRMLFKSVMYEEAIKVPLLLRLPGQRSQVKVTTPVSQVDLAPTLLELMRQPIPAHLHGQSWAPYLLAGKRLPARDVMVVWNGSDALGDADRLTQFFTPQEIEECKRKQGERIRAILTPDGWKLSITDEAKGELYHLVQDPKERVNLFYRKEHGETIRRLTEKIRLWQKATGDAELSASRRE